MDSNDSLNVLVVESDPRVRDLLRVGLDSFAGFQVDSVDPDWVEDAVLERRYQLVLVNLESDGGRDGLEIVREIRLIDPGPEFILLTRGRSSRFLSSQKNQHNILAFLTLPLDVTIFFKTIARARDRILENAAAARA
jgi:DNA-binding NtrC family response regulator